MEVLFWLGLIVIFLIIEAVTVGLATIWFAVGALAAMLAALLGGGIFLQILLFFLVSLVLLFYTRPVALKYFSDSKLRTNYENTIGKTVKITERVDNISGTGTAVLNGQEWTARMQKDDMIMEKGAQAKVAEVKGVKLILTPLEEDLQS